MTREFSHNLVPEFERAGDGIITLMADNDEEQENKLNEIAREDVFRGAGLWGWHAPDTEPIAALRDRVSCRRAESIRNYQPAAKANFQQQQQIQTLEQQLENKVWHTPRGRCIDAHGSDARKSHCGARNRESEESPLSFRIAARISRLRVRGFENVFRTTQYRRQHYDFLGAIPLAIPSRTLTESVPQASIRVQPEDRGHVRREQSGRYIEGRLHGNDAAMFL